MGKVPSLSASGTRYNKRKAEGGCVNCNYSKHVGDGACIHKRRKLYVVGRVK